MPKVEKKVRATRTPVKEPDIGFGDTPPRNKPKSKQPEFINHPFADALRHMKLKEDKQ